MPWAALGSVRSAGMDAADADMVDAADPAAATVARFWRSLDGVGAGDEDHGDGACGQQLQPPRADEEAGRAYPGHGRRVRLVAAPELFWVFLVGPRDTGGDGKRGVFGRAFDPILFKDTRGVLSILLAGPIPSVISLALVSLAIFWVIERCQILFANKWIHLCATASYIMIPIVNAHEEI
ncbi:MAG: hypothetical protein Q9167_002645 [Letrouitia subvulpina]